MPNKIKLLTIQEAANQLGLTVNKFLEYVYTKPPTEEIKSIDGGFYKVKNRVIIGATVADGKIYHLNKDDVIHFMNGHSILKVKGVVYPEYYEYEKNRNPAPEISWGKEKINYEIPIAGLRIPESEFNRQKKSLEQIGALPQKQLAGLVTSEPANTPQPLAGVAVNKPHSKLLRGKKQPYADKGEVEKFLSNIKTKIKGLSLEKMARRAEGEMKIRKLFLNDKEEPIYKRSTIIKMLSAIKTHHKK